MRVCDGVSRISEIPYNVENRVANVKPRRSRYEFRNDIQQDLLIVRDATNGLDARVNGIENAVIYANARGIAFRLLLVQAGWIQYGGE
jgi:hypothetical protein